MVQLIIPQITGQFIYLSLVNFLKKIMHKRLYNFLESNAALHLFQFGFRSKHSTTHTLISMTENIRNTIDNGTYGCGIFVDLQKAFDIVSRLYFD